jgi:hypothetical protein
MNEIEHKEPQHCEGRQNEQGEEDHKHGRWRGTASWDQAEDFNR